METKDILRSKLIGNYTGYILQDIGESIFTHNDLDMFRKLKRIPLKIGYFLHRNKIEAVYKSDCFTDPIDNYYLVVTTDETIFQLSY